MWDRGRVESVGCGRTAEEGGVARVAVVGKSKVGEWSFVNRRFGEERVVVSEVPGTTRDPVDSQMQYHDKTLVFVDTAGLRRQSKVKDSLEYYSALRTAKVVRRADICLVLVDATEPIHVQDIKVVEQAWEAGAGVLLVANKWDLVEKDHMTSAKFERDFRLRAPFLKWVPVIFTSALSGQRVRKCLDLILEVQDVRHERISTAEVNQALEALLVRASHKEGAGRELGHDIGGLPTIGDASVNALIRADVLAQLCDGLVGHDQGVECVDSAFGRRRGVGRPASVHDVDVGLANAAPCAEVEAGGMDQPRPLHTLDNPRP